MHTCVHGTSAAYRNMHYKHIQVQFVNTASQLSMDLFKLGPLPQNMLLSD